MANGGGDGVGCFEIKIGGGYSEVHECENSRNWIVQIYDQRK